MGAFAGHYSSWLNDTGLVTAFAFDGAPVEHWTQGRVRHGQLTDVELRLPVQCQVWLNSIDYNLDMYTIWFHKDYMFEYSVMSGSIVCIL